MDAGNAYGTGHGIKFKTKVVIISVFMITVVVSVLATYFIKTETELLRQELTKRSVALVENFAYNSDYPLLLEDSAAIGKLASALMKDEDVAFVDVRTGTGYVLFSAKKEGVSAAQFDLGFGGPSEEAISEWAKNEKDGHLIISRPVWSPVGHAIFPDGATPERAGKHPVGKIAVGFSLKKTDDLIRRSVVSTIMLTIAIMIVSILIAVMAANHFINPFLLLVRGTKELSAGNLSHRVNIRRADEIGELAGAFNNMAESIESSRKKLEDYSRTLEEKVRERTEAVTRRNERIIYYQRVLLELAKQPFEGLSAYLKMILEITAATLNVERAGVWLVSTDRSELVCEALYTRGAARHEKGARIPLEKYPLYRRALEESRTIAADDARRDARTSEMTEDYLLPFDITSILDASIRLQGKAIGVLRYGHTGDLRHWTLEEQEFAASVANKVSLGIEADQRREMEQAVIESEARYRTIFESTGTAMVIMEHDDLITLVNAEFEKMFGFKREDMEGKKDWAGIVCTHDAHTMDVCRKLRQVSPTASPRHYELKAADKEGRVKDIFMTVSMLPGTNRKIYSLIDISEKKRLENELHQVQKMDAIGSLAGGIAHDFNNLLMGIQGYASLMLIKIDAGHPHHEKLTRIEEHVQSGAELTRQLLGFARGGKYEIKPTDLNEILERTSIMFGRAKKEISIEKRCQEGLWTVDVDRGQIEQVLLNLYVNAWQAMPAGGVLYLESLNLYLNEEDSQTVHVEPGGYVLVSVRDTGMGMDAKTRERIFEPFFTTKEMGRGTGLGLATVYGIIKGHKGAINVYSEKGAGTTFNIYLPASGKEVLREAATSMDMKRGHETILLVDDEEPILDVSRALLETLGYRVLVAGSGREAVEIYSAQKDGIDLVIMDMIMPGLGGGETFDILKELNPDVQVILSSGYSLDGMAEQIMRRGCRSFIQKPFTLHRLSQKIREALS